MVHGRFFVEQLEEGAIHLTESEGSHAARSRRLSEGDVVMIFDGQGHESEGRIISRVGNKTEVEVGAVMTRTRPLPVLTLAVGLPKGPRQNFLIEKSTELGVASVQPILTERSVATASKHRLAKWRKTTIEAAKQSGQSWLPVVNPPARLQDVLQDLSAFDRVLLAAPFVSGEIEARPITEIIGELSKVHQVLGFIGPEGGWADREVDMIQAAGAEPVSLGPNILRIETAATSLAAVIHALAVGRLDQGSDSRNQDA